MTERMSTAAETAYRPPYPRVSAADLTGRDGWPYHADEELIAAANAAFELGRPLLLTGEAGTGKTDFAFALARQISDAPLEQNYVRSDSLARDLLYRYDSVRRFGDAQTGNESAKAAARDPRHYVELEGLGRALVAGPTERRADR